MKTRRFIGGTGDDEGKGKSLCVEGGGQKSQEGAWSQDLWDFQGMGRIFYSLIKLFVLINVSLRINYNEIEQSAFL